MSNYPEQKLSIKAWAEEDRPREKFSLRGRNSLSDAELLAILLSSGNRDESAVELAKRMLSAYAQDLNEFGKASLAELQKFRGIGEAKAITIAAALELGRRRQLTDVRDRPQIITSRDAYNLVAPLLLDLPHEEFWMLLLNRNSRVIARERLSVGGITGTIVDARVVFKRAIEGNATAIVLFHNHPSGSFAPSQSDLDITRKLVRSGEALDISVLDHLIVGETGYYSFADEGQL